MASMESGQTRAASLMNAARRSHFVAKIEKYEAKVRQAKAMMKEQREARSVVEQRPVFNTEEQQPRLAEKMVIPEQSALGFEQKAHIQHDRELSHKQLERDRSQRKPHKQPEIEYSHEQALQQYKRGFLSHEEALEQHSREDSPEQKTLSEQKEIISGMLQRSASSGMLQRSASSGMRTVIKGFDVLDMATCHAASAADNVFPIEIEPSDGQAIFYTDLKPPPTSEVNIDAVAGSLKIRIKAADMSTSMQEHAFRCARECLDALGKLQSKRIAYTLKKEFDKVYGPAWHCIVGTSFGSYVTHSVGGFVYFSLDKVSILLFKTAVEPIENL